MTTPDARLDLRRRQRLGMVEAVWGEHKTADQIIAILGSFAAAGELGLVTRVDPEKAARVCEALPAVELHADARCLTLGALPCLLYTSPSPRDLSTSRMPSSA